MEKQKKKDAGITLIALVISIIVMLILAGVSLNMMIGENGIVTQAQSAKLASEEAEWYEGAQMILASCYSGEEQICRLTAEEEASCAGDVAQIEILRKQKMVAHLRSAFEEISNGEAVMVNVYGEGYLIVVGKKALIVDKSYAILTSGENDYLVATGDEWLFEANGVGTAKLVSYNLDPSGIINIPTIVTNKENGEAYIVTEMGNDIFNYATRITKVDMSAATSLTTIGARAFALCSNLEINVPDDLPNSVTSIGDQAFNSCTLLQGNIDTILNKGYTLGKGVFSNCPNLTGKIQNVFDQTFYIINQETGEVSATKVEAGQFSGFSGLTGPLVIPKFIEEIGSNAFYECTGITSLTFEGELDNTSKLKKIDNNAFYGCSGMVNKLMLPDSVTTIGDSAFYRCTGLTGVKLSDSITTIGSLAFSYGYSMINTLVIPKSLTRIEYATFRDCRFYKIEFESTETEGVQYIGRYSFTWMTNLTEVILPKTLTQIDDVAFEADGKLTNVTWSSKLSTIGVNAFNNCTLLNSLPDTSSLTKIFSGAFRNCKSIGTEVSKFNVITYLEESNIESIGSSCFYGAKNLTGEYFDELENKSKNVITIGAAAFSETSVERVGIIPQSGDTEIAEGKYNCITKFRVSKNGAETTIIDIPNTVTKIGKDAFAGCTSLTKVSIPSSVTTIGDSVFSGCTNLTEIEFKTGCSIQAIPASFCQDCRNLSSIQILNTVTTIGTSAFNGCSALSTISIPGNVATIKWGAFVGSGLTSVTISAGVTNIEGSAFRSAPIEELIIPSSVTSIGAEAFEYCRNLEKVTMNAQISSLADNTFFECSNLEEITFTNPILTIGNNCFCKCNNLSKISIEWKDIESIGEWAFSQCQLLTGTVQLSSGCQIGKDAFFQCPLSVSK